MGKEWVMKIIMFGNIEIDVNIDRKVVSNKVPFGKKYFKNFIGYKNGDEKLMPKMSACKRDFDETK